MKKERHSYYPQLPVQQIYFLHHLSCQIWSQNADPPLCKRRSTFISMLFKLPGLTNESSSNRGKSNIGCTVQTTKVVAFWENQKISNEVHVQCGSVRNETTRVISAQPKDHSCATVQVLFTQKKKKRRES